MATRKRTSERTKAVPRSEQPRISMRFTGAAGGTHYVAGGKVILHKGETITATLDGHWLALLESGDAEIVEE